MKVGSRVELANCMRIVEGIEYVDEILLKVQTNLGTATRSKAFPYFCC